LTNKDTGRRLSVIGIRGGWHHGISFCAAFQVEQSSVECFPAKPNISCLIIAVIVLFFDYITGRIIQFPIVYAVPVGMAAWFSLRRTAYTMALALPFVRVVFHYPWHETQSIAGSVSQRCDHLAFPGFLRLSGGSNGLADKGAGKKGQDAGGDSADLCIV
jgi:hypothetical protein